VANGYAALYNHTNGSFNTAIGVAALYSDINGVQNTAIGGNALDQNRSGYGNTAIGQSALYYSTGNYNTALGDGAGTGVTTASNVIAIGEAGADVSNSCFIANIRGITTQHNDAMPVYIDGTGQLGTFNSSRRYKTDIKPIDKTSEAILALKPVSFRYKIHRDRRPQFGLIAEEVAQVNPDLVIYDFDGKPYTVRYDAVNAMLLNEFLKEHRKVEEQGRTIQEQEKIIGQRCRDFEARIAELKEQMESVVSRLTEQDSKIQRVREQVMSPKSGPQLAATDP
jgi:hypothetical protein